MLPIGQHLPAEAQGRQHNVAPGLVLRPKGLQDPFFHFLHAAAGTELVPLQRGRVDGLGLVPFDHAQRRRHAAGGHQQLTTFAAHG